MNALEIAGLQKDYPFFRLGALSFCVGEGRICGLVGANGAGKSTTLRAIAGLIRAQGEVRIFGMPHTDGRAKELLGFAGGRFGAYPRAKLSALLRTVSSFYRGWDEARCKRLMAQYGLRGELRVRELSEGMKVKFSIVLALSHGARLLVLDEPTSGLDPLSREEFCDTVLSLVREEGTTVLFSTHVTGDLARIADDVVLLSGGHVLADETLTSLKSRYRLALFAREEDAVSAGAIGIAARKEGFAGLIPQGETPACLSLGQPSLDEIVTHLERGRRQICSSN